MVAELARPDTISDNTDGAEHSMALTAQHIVSSVDGSTVGKGGELDGDNVCVDLLQTKEHETAPTEKGRTTYSTVRDRLGLACVELHLAPEHLLGHARRRTCESINVNK